MMTYPLKKTEKKILHYLALNNNLTSKEIAKQIGLNEVSVRRICNKLKRDNVLQQVNVPNYALLGYKILIVQKFSVASSAYTEIPELIKLITREWKNCVDCKETYDSKIIVRSLWQSAESFKEARNALMKKHGVKWLIDEEVSMVPLQAEDPFLLVRSLWDE